MKFSNAYSSRVSSEIKVFTFEREREIIKASLKYRYLFKNRWKRVEIVNGNLMFALRCFAIFTKQTRPFAES